MSYEQPSWAVLPSQQQDNNGEDEEGSKWMLIEIKNGVETNQYDLCKRPCTVLGRASDMVHITTAHESCSRQHARIAFDKQGSPWLRDLSSTHGTTVNKKQLPKDAIGKVESNSTKKGSRGVVLYPGDIIQFGASTRLYCLEGPASYERGAIKAKAAAAIAAGGAAPPTSDGAHRQAQHEKRKDDNVKGGISWGIDMDDHNDTIDKDNDPQQDALLQQALEDPSKIPERHRKLFERLTTKKYKLANLQTESERIRRKGVTEELTDGQRKQLSKNEQRERDIQNEIDDLEHEISEKLNPNSGKSSNETKNRKRRRKNDDDDDIDDFYDRTKNNDKAKNGNEAETEESLTLKWKNLIIQLKEKDRNILKSEENVSKLEYRISVLKAQRHEEDVFFLQNDLDILKDKDTKLKSQRGIIIKEFDATERLLNIVTNQKIFFNRETGYIGHEEEPKLSTNLMMPPPPPILPPSSSSSKTATTKSTTSCIDMPPPPPPSSLGNNAKIKASLPSKTLPSTTDKMQFASKNKDDASGPSQQQQQPDPAIRPSNPPKSSSNKKMKGPARPHQSIAGTLAAIRSAAAGSNSKTTQDTTSSNETEKHAASSSTATFNMKKDEWIVPEGQDGSGRTKLNEKFAGRY